MKRFSREFYRPRNARVTYPDDIPGGEIHRWENGSLAPDSQVPFATCFSGTRDKPDMDQRFKSWASREIGIINWMNRKRKAA